MRSALPSPFPLMSPPLGFGERLEHTRRRAAYLPQRAPGPGVSTRRLPSFRDDHPCRGFSRSSVGVGGGTTRVANGFGLAVAFGWSFR